MSARRGGLLRRLVGRRGREAGPVVISALDPALPTDLRGARDSLALRVEGVACLLALIPACDDQVRVRSLRVTVTPWTRRGPHVAVRIGHVAGLVRHAVRTERRSLQVDLRTDEPTDLAELLAAVAVAAVGSGRAHSNGAPDVAVLASEAAGSSGRGFVSTARVLDVTELVDERVRPTDVLVARPSEVPAGIDRSITLVELAGDPQLVDPAVHRPVGRRDYGLPGALATSLADGGLLLAAPDGSQVVQLPPGASVTDLDLRALTSYASVTTAGSAVTSSAAAQLRQLSAAGLVVAADVGASVVPDLLTDLWSRAVPAEPALMEEASVAQRRTAHRLHSVVRRTAGGGSGAPTVSVLLCSNRPDQVARAVRRVGRFDYPRLQLVLGLHGIEPPADLAEVLAALGAHVDVVVVPVAADVPFGSALAAMSTRAEGDLLTKLDDDDEYGVEHLWDLVVCREYSGAALVGKLAEHVYLVDEDVTVRRTLPGAERYGRTVAGGTMLMSHSDLQAVGGWRPVHRSVDRALLDRVLRAGAGIYRTHGLGYVYRRGDHHTWEAPSDFTADVQSRRAGLVVPGEPGGSA